MTPQQQVLVASTFNDNEYLRLQSQPRHRSWRPVWNGGVATSSFIEDDELVAAAVTAELRILLAGGKTLTAMRSLDLPALDLVLKETGRTRDGLVGALQDAIEAIDDPIYRAAASDMFPLPYTDIGWPKLSVRGQRAASRFGVKYDAFRRGARDRPSRMDDVAVRVGASLVGVLRVIPEPKAISSAVEESGDEDSQPDRATSELTRGRNRSRRLARIALVGAIVVTTAAGIQRSRDGTSGAWPDVRCSGSVGALDAGLAQEPASERLTTRLQSLFDRAGGVAVAGCPTAPTYRWQKLVVQEMAREGVPSGALVASPNGVDVYLNRAAWISYFQLGGKGGDAVQAMGGLIVRVIEYDDRHVEIDLSSGTVLVAERPDAPYFWIPAPFVQWWRDHPELGLPTGNPLPSSRQEFQHGMGVVRAESVGDPMVHLVDRPRDELPTLESIRDRILRQADGTAWLIDDAGSRLWIPDGGTWACLGGEARRLGGDLPGYAIGTIPFGGHARCPA